MKTSTLLLSSLCFLLLLACQKEQNSKPDLLDELQKSSKTSISLEKRLRSVTDSFLLKKKLPGISIHVIQPSSSFNITSGYSDLKSKTIWRKELPGYAQSISKTFTAICILQLQEQGKLKLDDQISKYLNKSIIKNIPGAECITIRQLLNHSSGIIDYVEDGEFQDAVFSGNIFPLTSDKVLPFIYQKPLKFKPGTDESYSNTNYTLLALIIDRVAGCSHAIFLKKNIIDKISLNHTYYLPTSTKISRIVEAYSYNEETGDYEDVTTVQVALTSGMIGDDGIVTTSEDLALFYKSLLEDKILINKNSLNEMINFKGLKVEGKYGLGIIKNSDHKFGTRIGHSGAGLGAGAEAWYLEKTKTYVVIMTNVGTVFDGVASETFEELTRRVLEIESKG